MVKTGIIGADTAQAGELIRILINHPETDIVTLHAPELAGRSVASYHYGLIGESIVNFSDKIDPSSLDLIFIAGDPSLGSELMDNRNEWPELRIIDLNQKPLTFANNGDVELGLSEINRKGLVRGAKYASLTSAPVVISLIALQPLGRFLMLNSPVDIEFTVPADQLEVYKDFAAIKNEISERLHEIQTSFDADINISLIKAPKESRVIGLKTSLDCNMPIDEILKIYDSVYDDHNFTFTTLSPVSWKEVEGTQKVVISLNKTTSGKLEIYALADSCLRGGAGDGVHILNLLFGLYEKTGLHLKSSVYGIPDHLESASSSWFA